MRPLQYKHTHLEVFKSIKYTKQCANIIWLVRVTCGLNKFAGAHLFFALLYTATAATVYGDGRLVRAVTFSIHKHWLAMAEELAIDVTDDMKMVEGKILCFKCSSSWKTFRLLCKRDVIVMKISPVLDRPVI